MSTHRLCWIFIVVCGLGCNNQSGQSISGRGESKSSTSELVKDEGYSSFNPKTIVRQPFPVIKDVPIGTVEDASGQIADDDLVLGIHWNGIARAYPVAALDSPPREIINDRIGDTAVMATW